MARHRAWNSSLNAPTKPMARKTRLRNRGGRLFPQSPEDKAYFDALGQLLTEAGRLRCDGCARQAYCSRAHLNPRSRGGCDRNNIALLCESEPGYTNDYVTVPDVIGCHPQQEKQTEAFVAETGVDLWAKARARTERFDDAESVARFIVEEIERG